MHCSFAFNGRKLKETWEMIIDIISERDSLLDIGYCMGESCFELYQKKASKVICLVLSLKMIQFAVKRYTYPDLIFVHGDGAELSANAENAFDFVVMLVFIHELKEENQLQALKEALLVAKKLIICDSAAPLCLNKGRFLIWLAETLFGYEHKSHFKRFLTQGGIRGLLKASGLSTGIEYSQVFWYGAREIAVILKMNLFNHLICSKSSVNMSRVALS